MKLCNSSPSLFLGIFVLCPNPNLLKIVLLEVLSSSSNLTSSNGASETIPSSTLGTLDTRNLVPIGDEMDELRVQILESRLSRGVPKVGEADPRVGDAPPISKDLLYPLRVRKSQGGCTSNDSLAIMNGPSRLATLSRDLLFRLRCRLHALDPELSGGEGYT